MLVGDRRPGGGEDVISPPPEQLGTAGRQLIELEFISFLTAVELDRPAAALDFLGTAVVLEDRTPRREVASRRRASSP